MKNQVGYVEVKTVTWVKDSHGLFDYESQNVNYAKTKVESTSKVLQKDGEFIIKDTQELETQKEKDLIDKKCFFTIVKDNENDENFTLQIDEKTIYDEEEKTNSLFLIVRSLKNDNGIQKGYPLEIGDILRVGRIEYRVIEYGDQNLKVHSVMKDPKSAANFPFKLQIKNVEIDKSITKPQCRICLMDEQDSCESDIINPCNCKGTSGFLHINCLQTWISSKSKKKKNNFGIDCYYWNKLNCEVCGVALPDYVYKNGEMIEIAPIARPQKPYIILERVFYDKSKENSSNAKMMVLVSIEDPSYMIKLGRGHECDLRENDISVSRCHAFIKYQDNKFIIIDNNSKFGTLVLLRKSWKIEKKKIGVQIGRTVFTFSLKYSSINNIPIFKMPMLMEKFYKIQSPKNGSAKMPLLKQTSSPSMPFFILRVFQ